MCFEKEGFVLLMDSLRDAFGSAGESMVYHMSKQYGRYIIKSTKDESSEYDRTAIGGYLDKVKQLGWGEMRFDDMDWVNKEFQVTMVENNFSDYCRSGQEGMCFFIKGVIAGTIQELLGEDMLVTEKACIKNGDNNCVFKLKTTHT